MKRKKPKDKPIKVTIKYKDTPDKEERFKRIAELLLSKQNKCQKNASSG